MKKNFKLCLFTSVALGCLSIKAGAMEPDPNNEKVSSSVLIPQPGELFNENEDQQIAEVMTIIMPHAFSCEFLEEERKASIAQQTILNPDSPIEKLHDEIMFMIFSFLNQRDIPSVTRTSKRWQRLMDNNQLWEGYAKRAFIIMRNEDYSPDKNYKELIETHCMPSFIDLGTLNGGEDSLAYGVNCDGSIIVGHADDGAQEGRQSAFRWTQEEGIKSLGTLNDGRVSFASGISCDGSVIIGYAEDEDGQEQRAFRWTDEKGMEFLGVLNGGQNSLVSGVNFDGSMIVGIADDGAQEGRKRAFRWTREEGIKSLGALNGGTASQAYGISFNGSVIVGEANDGDAQNEQRAFRWTREKGMESLGVLNGGQYSTAYGVSYDGSVIVGISDDGAAQGELRAFRWTQEEGMNSLGTFGTQCVNFDCSVVAGYASDSAGQGKLRAFRWAHEESMEFVEKLLADKGLLPPDWILNKVVAVTPSGVVFIGLGEYKVQMENRNNETQTHAWRVQMENRNNETQTHAWRAVIPRRNLF